MEGCAQRGYIVYVQQPQNEMVGKEAYQEDHQIGSDHPPDLPDVNHIRLCHCAAVNGPDQEPGACHHGGEWNPKAYSECGEHSHRLGGIDWVVHETQRLIVVCCLFF